LVSVNKNYIWIHNDKLKKNKTIPANQLNKYLKLGWCLKRKQFKEKIKKTCIVNIKTFKYLYVVPSDVDKFLKENPNWLQGCIRPHFIKNNKIWIHNDKLQIRKQINISDIEQYAIDLKNDWKIGKKFNH